MGSRRRIHSTETCATVNESIAPNEYIVASRSAWPGNSAIEAMIEKVMIATCGVRNRGWTPQPLRQLTVVAHREGQPRDADHPGVGGDHEDHRCEDADVDAKDVGDAGTEAEVLDDPEHRIAGERGAELGRVFAGRALGHRHRREGDHRQQRVEADHGGDVAGAPRGIDCAASSASSDMFEIVSMPV